jgi:metallo-beta-lactamase family protein
MKITFFGAAQETTGACYLLESGQSKILIDCGLFQQRRMAEDRNYELFPFSSGEIEAVLVTHAHLDHTGRLPKLVKSGFGGKIFSTPATRDFAALMLEDSLGVMLKEAGGDKSRLIYNQEDLAETAAKWQGVEYHREFAVADFKIKFLDAGHILGSAMIEIKIEGKKIVFSGDLGNPPTPLLPPTEKVSDAEFLILESVYGNRLHEDRQERKLKIERVIENTVKAGGVLMIPAFSLERTQELLFELNDLVEKGRVPEVPVFLDSPLAIRATEIYKKYESYYNKEARYIISSGDQIFKFPMLRFTLTTDESKTINDAPSPKIIIAGSGMSNGGRILHHERRYLPDPNSALLMIGYQSAGSRGRQLQEGAKEVEMFGEKIPVKCRIETVRGYSAHPDREMLLDFVRNSADTLKKVFVVQGEPAAALFLVQRIRDYLGIDAVAPKYGDSFKI